MLPPSSEKLVPVIVAERDLLKREERATPRCELRLRVCGFSRSDRKNRSRFLSERANRRVSRMFELACRDLRYQIFAARDTKLTPP